MVEETTPTPPGEITDQDKLMGLLSYLTGIIALVVLFTEGGKRPYQRYHAVQALAVWVAITVIAIVLACVLGVLTFWIAGCGAILAFLVYVIPIYYAVLAYQGKYFTVPVITDFIRNQGWIPTV